MLTVEEVLSYKEKGHTVDWLERKLLEEDALLFGGFSMVYKVEDVYVKVNNSPFITGSLLTEKGVEALSKEGETLSLLKGLDNVPQVIYYDERVIIMTGMQGKSLKDLPQAEKEEIPNESWYQLIDLLESVRLRGVRPLDVHLENIYYDKETKLFSLIDFGFYVQEESSKLHLPIFLLELTEDFILQQFNGWLYTLLTKYYDFETGYDEGVLK